MSPVVRRLLMRANAVRGGAGTVPSPCASICRMADDGRWCEGCLRTIEEIASWSALDEEAKRAELLRTLVGTLNPALVV